MEERTSLFPLVPSIRPRGASRPMHSQDSAQIAEALFDAFNAHDLDRLEALTSDGFLGIGPDSPDLRMGRRGGGGRAGANLSGFPHSKWAKERLFRSDTAFVLPMVYPGTPPRAFRRGATVPPNSQDPPGPRLVALNRRRRTFRHRSVSDLPRRASSIAAQSRRP